MTAWIIAGFLAFAFGAIAVSMATGWGFDRTIPTRRKLHPDSPWLWVKRWDGGCIAAARTFGPAVSFVIFALCWIAALAGVGVLVSRIEAPAWVSLFVLAFGLSGVILLAVAARGLASALRFAPAVFQMTTVPGVLGGRLSGTIEAPANLPFDGDVVVTLKCIRYSGAGSQGRGGGLMTLWQEEQRRPASTHLPVAFAIPSDLPGTTPAATIADHFVSWRLLVRASVPGADWSAEFDVPVFRTGPVPQT